MNTYFPDYYKNFKCIASLCRHTCCAGWEIDVDEDALKRFMAVPDISKHIKYGSIVMDKTADDMVCYLNAGYFPSENGGNQGGQQVQRRGSTAGDGRRTPATSGRREVF